MGKRLVFFLSAFLLAAVAHAAAQDQSQTSIFDSQQSTQQGTDCSDPISSQLPQCQGGNGPSMFGNGQGNFPIQQPGMSNNPSMYGGSQNQPGLTGINPLGMQLPQGLNYNDTTSTTSNQYLQLRRNMLSYYPLPPEQLTEYQRMVAASAGQVLPIFGSNLFRVVPSTFAPADQVPVTPEYVIGPADELRVRIWGQINFNANLQVDRSGYIYLPQVGGVHVAGVPFADLDHQLRVAVAHSFKNFDLHVDLGQLRSIQVFVVGQARRPGAYTVSSLSTLVNALFACGGPTIDGSLRDIQVKRGGTVVTHFDLYDLLIYGDKSKDVQLLPGDVIYIPPAGAQVALWGSVRNSAIYELRDRTTVQQLLTYAGGLTALASSTRVNVDRVRDHQTFESAQFALGPAGLTTPVRDGDLLRVLSVIPKYEHTVTLRGNTANPGRFAWHEGMHLSDLIPDQQSLLTRNYWWRRSQLGLPEPEFQPFLAPSLQYQPNAAVDLLGTQGQLCNPFLSPYTSPILQPRSDAQVAGEPYATPYNQPCLYPYQLTTLYGLQPGQGNGSAQANQNNQQGLNGQSQILQQQQQPTAQSLFAQSLYGQQIAGPQQTTNPSSASANRANASTLAAPQDNRYTENGDKLTGLTDVRLSAPEINWSYAVVERMDPQTLKTSLIPFNLGRLVMNHDPSQDLQLQAGDVVSVFSQSDIRVPLAQQTKFVRLEGEFVSSGIYSVQPGETLRQLVVRAGGLTPDAYLFGSELTRESTRRTQQRRLDEYTQQLELEVQRGALAQASSAVASAQDLASASQGANRGGELINRLRQLRATGRIVLSLKPGSSGVDSLPDLPLEDGDRFVVPSIPSGVNVVGSVYDQNTFIFQHEHRIGDYLRLAGGPNRDADRRHSFVIRADGSVLSRMTDRGFWGDSFDSQAVHPGDTIVVPEKAYRPGAMRGFLDWSQVFSQLALGAATINILR